MSDVIEAVKRQVREPKNLNGAEYSAVDDIVRSVGKSANIKDVAADIIADLSSRLDKLTSEFPQSADGQALTLGRACFVVRALADLGPGAGYGRGPLDGHSDVIACRVVSVGILGNQYRRASFLDGGASFTFSADLRGVFIDQSKAEAAALAAAKGE